MRIADRLSQVDLVDLHDLLLDGRARAGVDAALVIEAGPSVIVDAALGAGPGCWSWSCLFRVERLPVVVVFAGEYSGDAQDDVERELLRTARAIRLRLVRALRARSGARGAA